MVRRSNNIRTDGRLGGGATVTQNRVHNLANETGAITGTGADWVDPVHDAAGNMTTMPKPGAEGTSVTCTYDAWNRLASTSDGTTAVKGYVPFTPPRRIARWSCISSLRRVGLHWRCSAWFRS